MHPDVTVMHVSFCLTVDLLPLPVPHHHPVSLIQSLTSIRCLNYHPVLLFSPVSPRQLIGRIVTGVIYVLLVTPSHDLIHSFLLFLSSLLPFCKTDYPLVCVRSSSWL